MNTFVKILTLSKNIYLKHLKIYIRDSILPHLHQHRECSLCIKEMRNKGKSLKEVTDDCHLVKHCFEKSDFKEQMDKRKSSVHNW